MNNLAFTKRFLLLVTPLVTGSVFAASPSLATTLAFSEATVEIDNFSQNPLEVLALTNASSFTMVTSGEVTAKAEADAAFINNPSEPPSASNSSFSRTNGSGSNYSGLAQSVAEVIGYNFLVGSGETFSFDFQADLDLETSIDNPASEFATADGSVSLQLYDSTDANNWVPLDSFTLSGNLTTPGDDDSLNIDESANITFSSSESSSETAFGGTQESANASIQASLSRTFESPTRLTLTEVKMNDASVIIPEPSNKLAFISLGLIWFCYKVGIKAFKARSKITH